MNRAKPEFKVLQSFVRTSLWPKIFSCTWHIATFLSSFTVLFINGYFYKDIACDVKSRIQHSWTVGAPAEGHRDDPKGCKKETDDWLPVPRWSSPVQAFETEQKQYTSEHYCFIMLPLNITLLHREENVEWKVNIMPWTVVLLNNYIHQHIKQAHIMMVPPLTCRLYSL